MPSREGTRRVELGGSPFEQNAHFQDAGLYVGMADGAQEDGVELLELFDRNVGQDLAGALVALSRG
jgi:hypothetical protein